MTACEASFEEALISTRTGLPNSIAGSDIPEAKFELPLQSLAKLEGRDVLIERRIGDRWQFLSVSDNQPIFKTDRQLARHQANGEFALTLFNRDGEQDLPSLTPLVVGNNHAANLRKHEFVQACLAAAGNSRSRQVLKPVIERVASARNEKRPGFTTVLNWIDEYIELSDRYGTACFSDKHYKKGFHGHRLAKHQEQAIEYGIERWLRGATKRVAYLATRRYVHLFDMQFGKHINKSALGPTFVDQKNRLKPPSERTFQRRCNEVDPLLRESMRKGFRSAQHKFRTFSTLAVPDQPYAEVEVDHCTLDIVLIDPSGLPLGRPDLIIFRDRATAMILGYALGFEKPSYAAFLRGLRHAMYPKDLSRYPAIKNPWPCFGRIGNLEVDNGLHFIGDNIREAGRELKFNIVRFHARHPWEKGALERFFGTFGVAVVHMLPGTTLENVLARKDHENLGEASLTIEEFEGLLVRWICDDYHISKRRGLGPIRGFGDIPLRVWSEKAKGFKTAPLPPEELFVALAGDWEMRTINKYGVEWDYVRYEGPVLSGILGHPAHRPGMKYKVSRDPWDLGRVFLLNHHTNEIVEVPATEGHKQVSGRSLHQHRVILSYAKQRIATWEKDHWEAIAEASVQLAEISEKIRKSPRRKTIEAKVARFLEWDRNRPIRSKIAVPSPQDGSGTRYLSYQRQSASERSEGLAMAAQHPAPAVEIRMTNTPLDENFLERELEAQLAKRAWGARHD